MNQVKVARFVERTLFATALVLTATFASAQYTVTNTGGTQSMPGGTHPYGTSSDGYGGGTPGGQCSGPITTTFSYPTNATSPLPPVAIVCRTCVATSWSGAMPFPVTAGDVDNGLGDKVVTVDTVTQVAPMTYLYYETKTSGLDASGNPIKHYEVVNSPSSSFTRTTSPSASAPTGSAPASASVKFNATIYSARLNLSGVLDPINDKRLLIGQQLAATANLGGLGGATPTYKWTMSGGRPFSNYIASSEQVPIYVPWSPGNATSTTCSFAAPGAVTVQCAVSLPDIGQTVNLSDQVSAVPPSYQVWAILGQMHNQLPDPVTQMWLTGANYTDPATQTDSTAGMWFVGWTDIPGVFKGAGSGSWFWTQLMTFKNQWYEDTSGNYFDANDDVGSGNLVLDLSYPYGNITFPVGSTQHAVADSPSMPLSGQMVEAYSKRWFQSYAMFQAPGTSQVVPLAELTWWCEGHAKRPKDWQMVDNNQEWYYTADYPPHPLWNSVAVPSGYTQRSNN